MKIKKITENKNAFLPLLLLADPDKKMIDKYLDQSEMFVMYENEQIIAQCVVQRLSKKECEIKNIAVSEEFQGNGFGRKLLEEISKIFKEKCSSLLVGTSTGGVDFYKKCGFKPYYTIENFFIDNYAEPVYDNNERCTHMFVLKKNL